MKKLTQESIAKMIGEMLEDDGWAGVHDTDDKTNYFDKTDFAANLGAKELIVCDDDASRAFAIIIATVDLEK